MGGGRADLPVTVCFWRHAQGETGTDKTGVEGERFEYKEKRTDRLQQASNTKILWLSFLEPACSGIVYLRLFFTPSKCRKC